MGQAQYPVKAHKNQAEKSDPGPAADQPGTPQLERPKGSLSGSFSLGEQLVKIAGLLAVFGYMELRANLNYLGISSTSALGLERYLSEFYAMCTDVLIRVQVFSSLILPGILVAAAVLIVIRAADRKGKARQAARNLFHWLRDRSTSPWFPGVLLLLLITWQLWFLNRLSGVFFTGAVVGPLQLLTAQREAGVSLCSVLLGVIVLGVLLAWALAPGREHTARTEERTARRLWNIYALALAGLGLVYLPILYGAFIRETSYPRVSVKSEATAKMCGLLVLQTADEMRIWTVGNADLKKVGRIVVMKASDARLVITGTHADLIALTERAVMGGTIDYCPE